MDELLMERYALAAERVREIREEQRIPQPFYEYFRRTALFLVRTLEIMERDEEPDLPGYQSENRELYEELLPENYGSCYGNPDYASAQLGEYGRLFSFLYTELRGCISFAYEKSMEEMTVALELFLLVYGSFCGEELPGEKSLKEILVSYVEDYCQDMVEKRTRDLVDPSQDFAVKIIMESDLSDVRYLYRFGEFIGENELRAASLLGSMTQEEVDALARVYTEGYRMGFENGRKNLKIKKSVDIQYHLGFERIIRAAVLQFHALGLAPVIHRTAVHAVNKRGMRKSGYTGGCANPQFDYDHREDSALFLTEEMSRKKRRILQVSYEKVKKLAKVMGGPAVIETFGETPFSPAECSSAFALSEEQKKLQIEYNNEAMQITNRYIPGEERSFTIISFPVAEIGEPYEEIFRETVKINTLDNCLYRKIQQTLIDTLDSCEWVEVKGKGENQTDLLIHLHELKDPKKQTNFENCVADVNIPVGEVFTSPVLAGTGGVLNVSGVYLEGLLFKNLTLVFDCGQVIDYSCDNFESEEENRKYIEENILHHHKKIPMGEFAIGTNTTAYTAARKYHIEDRLPILIAEKTGPHFAVGDTCYSWEEDTPVYNPDGKEIIARDNEISALRKEDLSMAYYGCHTDITIPFDEIGSISVIDDDGEMTAIIRDGRFVLPGTEALNEALEQ